MVPRWKYERVKRQRDEHRQHASERLHLLRATRPVAVVIAAEVPDTPPFFSGRAVSTWLRDTVVDLYMLGMAMASTVAAAVAVLAGAGMQAPDRLPNSGHLTLRALVERSVVEIRALALDLARAASSYGWRWDSTTTYTRHSYFSGSICYRDATGENCQVQPDQSLTS